MEQNRPEKKKKDPMSASREMLKKWLNENDCENIVIIGLNKNQSWKYAYTTPEFEFLAACEGVLQKLKIENLSFPKKEG